MSSSFRISDSTTISLVNGDITELDVEAIVNAANSSLMGGGGVDGAIHRRGGLRILEECMEIRKKVWKNGLPQGEAVITSGGDLKANFVIHTVGPIWSGSKSDASALESCYRKSLSLAEANNLASIGFPAISTGAYGYPMQEASKVAIRSTLDYFSKKRASSVRRVVFVLFTRSDLKVYLETARTLIEEI